MWSEHFHPSVLARLTLALLALPALLGGGALAAQPLLTTVSCPFVGTARAATFHGIYVTSYAGTNLSLVKLEYSATAAGLFSISLTAHRGAFDGPRIGTTQTQTVNVSTSETAVIFDFGGAPVTPGDTIAFTQTAVPIGVGGSLLYDEGIGPCNGVFETEGTTAPLDTVRNHAVGLSISQLDAGSACVPSDTALCLDGRFLVTASFHTTQNGGQSGAAQAITLNPLGAIHGGLFWFFSPTNPEMLVKVIDGCAVNDRFWAFLAADTNVGYTVTIADTQTGKTKTYINPDLTAALPVQDTSALRSCPCRHDSDCPAGLLCCQGNVPGSTLCLAPTAQGVCPLVP